MGVKYFATILFYGAFVMVNIVKAQTLPFTDLINTRFDEVTLACGEEICSERDCNPHSDCTPSLAAQQLSDVLIEQEVIIENISIVQTVLCDGVSQEEQRYLDISKVILPIELIRIRICPLLRLPVSQLLVRQSPQLLL